MPYVNRTWIGEGFGFDNTLDFWLVEMSGIPFGLMSETLDARNVSCGITINGDKALVVLANWTDQPQTAKITYTIPSEYFQKHSDGIAF